MISCQNCSREFDQPVSSALVESLLCRECLRSPAIQMRVLLVRSRDRGVPFERAFHLALHERIRWPHPTDHRREWKATLGYVAEDATPLERSRAERQVEVWRAAYHREPVGDRRVDAVAVVADLAA